MVRFRDYIKTLGILLRAKREDGGSSVQLVVLVQMNIDRRKKQLQRGPGGQIDEGSTYQPLAGVV